MERITETSVAEKVKRLNDFEAEGSDNREMLKAASDARAHLVYWMKNSNHDYDFPCEPLSVDRMINSLRYDTTEVGKGVKQLSANLLAKLQKAIVAQEKAFAEYIAKKHGLSFEAMVASLTPIQLSRNFLNDLLLKLIAQERVDDIAQVLTRYEDSSLHSSRIKNDIDVEVDQSALSIVEAACGLFSNSDSLLEALTKKLDDGERAKRVVKAITSDVAAYNRERISRGELKFQF